MRNHRTAGSFCFIVNYPDLWLTGVEASCPAALAKNLCGDGKAKRQPAEGLNEWHNIDVVQYSAVQYGAVRCSVVRQAGRRLACRRRGAYSRSRDAAVL